MFKSFITVEDTAGIPLGILLLAWNTPIPSSVLLSEAARGALFPECLFKVQSQTQGTLLPGAVQQRDRLMKMSWCVLPTSSLDLALSQSQNAH